MIRRKCGEPICAETATFDTMKFLFSVILLVQFSGLYGQRIYGVVSDEKTNEPLPYVHIGVEGKNLGVISRDDGSFEADLSGATPEDKLVFSIIGYETKSWVVGELKSGRMDIRMAPKTYKLKEVVIRPGKAVVEKLGRYTPSKITIGQSGLKEFGFGGEWGLRITPNARSYALNDLQFHIRFLTVDSMLFRINMYKVDNDMPGESILDRELFMTGYKNKKWIIRDLKTENIVINHDVIVTVEVVRVWFSKRGENRIFFTHGKGYAEGRSYYRASSQAKWTVDEYPPITLYLSAERL